MDDLYLSKEKLDGEPTEMIRLYYEGCSITFQTLDVTTRKDGEETIYYVNGQGSSYVKFNYYGFRLFMLQYINLLRPDEISYGTIETVLFRTAGGAEWKLTCE
ncbi:MAG: hypothetical protein KC483_02580 [Nitrosarchaeum sp.]|nr:hypothetical protein [Nitrosarchaeum sp.]